MKKFWRSGLIALCLLGGLVNVFSQDKWKFEDDGCGTTRWSRSPYGESTGTFNLQIKEKILPAPPKQVSIDAERNGGIRVRGWERNEIFIKACVQARGANEAEAISRASEIVIETVGETIRAFSPTATDDDYFFGVSYDIRLPFNTDLNLKSNNGGINLSNIQGSIEFDINNGGVILNNIAGEVRGQTNNGSLTFNLSGDKWQGGGIDARTNNGSIFTNFPENYSARLETATRRGNFYVNFPVETERSDKYRFDTILGAGGAVIKTQTNNGAVNIKRQTKFVKENTL